ARAARRGTAKAVARRTSVARVAPRGIGVDRNRRPRRRHARRTSQAPFPSRGHGGPAARARREQSMSESTFVRSSAPHAGALLIDQRQRWKHGERVLVEDYLRDQPGLGAEHETILDLLYHEILLREEQGETPHLEEYLRRFPQFTRELQLYF